MKDFLYYITAGGFILLSFVCLFLIWRALKKVLQKTDFSPAKKKWILRGTLFLFIGDIALMSFLSLIGFTADFTSLPPRPPMLAIFIFIVFIYLTFTTSVGKILIKTPPEWILYLQSFRVLVEVLLWMLFIQNLLPIQMTFEGRNWDILTGILGPIVGYFCFVRKTWSPKIAFWYNLLGLVLLFNILTIAVLSMPTPIRQFMNEPSNTIVGYFPFIFLPNILVPIAFIMHLFSLRQLSLMENKQAQ
jgi:hypothetical protein